MIAKKNDRKKTQTYVWLNEWLLMIAEQHGLVLPIDTKTINGYPESALVAQIHQQ